MEIGLGCHMGNEKVRIHSTKGGGRRGGEGERGRGGEGEREGERERKRGRGGEGEEERRGEERRRGEEERRGREGKRNTHNNDSHCWINPNWLMQSHQYSSHMNTIMQKRMHFSASLSLVVCWQLTFVGEYPTMWAFVAGATFPPSLQPPPLPFPLPLCRYPAMGRCIIREMFDLSLDFSKTQEMKLGIICWPCSGCFDTPCGYIHHSSLLWHGILDIPEMIQVPDTKHQFTDSHTHTHTHTHTATMT